MFLEINELSYSTNEIEILKQICFSLDKGMFVGIIGANGSGKSTLLKNIYRVLLPTHGYIKINQKSLQEMTNKQIACEMAVVSQEFDYGFDFTVREIILMGRYPRKEFYEAENQTDEKIVNSSLDKVGMRSFKHRSFSTLSGGEKQRVLIARAVAQETQFIIMDEPTNHLDVGYQMKVMDLIRGLGKTVLTAIHDLNMAMVYCDQVVVMHQGKIYAMGKPNDILTADLIKTIYGVPAHIEYNEFLQRNMIIFKSSHELNPQGS